MSKSKKPFIVSKRKDSKTFSLTINPTSGISSRICKDWKRKSFHNLPAELAHLRNPKNKSTAEQTALVFIQYLKNNDVKVTSNQNITVGTWIEKFISLESSPRAARNIAKNRPYSVKTITSYKCYFDNHIKDDFVCKIFISEIVEQDIFEFINRLAIKKLKNGQKMVGTRTFEGVIKFIRMAFTEYQKTHSRWINPFLSIDPPQNQKKGIRDVLTEDEMVKLFNHNVLKESMEIAICTTMFLSGLRRAEIFALTTECLDWKTPKILVKQAWQNFDSKDRVLGPTKGKKIRQVTFHPMLQDAIKSLWKENGKHEFVFSYKNGTTPGPSWIKGRFKKWLERAGIEIEGRNIVPHSSRHSLASLLESRGASARYIQDLLGHSDFKTTIGYLHSNDDTLLSLVRKIDDAVTVGINL